MIPKTIHYCWFGRNPIPDEHRGYIEGWKTLCPDYEIIEWNEGNYDVTKNRYMHEAYTAEKWGFVPDYARLDIIYNYGGIYLDTDVELLKPLDTLLENKVFMGFEGGKYVALGLGFGATKGHPAIKKLRDYYEGISFINDDGSYNTLPCSVHQTLFLMDYGLRRVNKKQIVEGITIYPSEYFAPQSCISHKTKVTANTYSVHHYNASWFDERQRDKWNYQGKLAKYVGGRAAQVIATIRYSGIRKTVQKIYNELILR